DDLQRSFYNPVFAEVGYKEEHDTPHRGRSTGQRRSSPTQAGLGVSSGQAVSGRVSPQNRPQRRTRLLLRAGTPSPLAASVATSCDGLHWQRRRETCHPSPAQPLSTVLH